MQHCSGRRNAVPSPVAFDIPHASVVLHPHSQRFPFLLQHSYSHNLVRYVVSSQERDLILAWTCIIPKTACSHRLLCWLADET